MAENVCEERRVGIVKLDFAFIGGILRRKSTGRVDNMNKIRREALEKISTGLEDLKADLETLRDEEQDYADNMPEGLQSSEKHDTAENAVSSMDEAIDNLDSVVSSIGEASE